MPRSADWSIPYNDRDDAPWVGADDEPPRRGQSWWSLMNHEHRAGRRHGPGDRCEECDRRRAANSTKVRYAPVFRQGDNEAGPMFHEYAAPLPEAPNA